MADDSLANRTILAAFDAPAELRNELASRGGRVVSLPKLDIGPVTAAQVLDEAVENLYGYDWLVFIKRHAVKFFLERFSHLGHETSEIDSLRVCAIGESTATTLELSQVHVDVVSSSGDPGRVIDALAAYLGGVNELGGLNFLIPQATIGQDYLKPTLGEFGARADVPATYQTVASGDSSLARLQTLILGDGIDCVGFASEAEVETLASLFDTNYLPPILRSVSVACLDQDTENAADRFSLHATIRPKESSFAALVEAIARHFSD
jgi:uroporphyrinogen-III synthase